MSDDTFKKIFNNYPNKKLIDDFYKKNKLVLDGLYYEDELIVNNLIKIINCVNIIGLKYSNNLSTLLINYPVLFYQDCIFNSNCNNRIINKIIFNISDSDLDYLKYIINNKSIFKLSLGEINLLNTIINSNDNKYNVRYFNAVSKRINMFNEIMKKVKNKCCADLNKKITIKVSEDVIHLDGQKFNLLVHCLTGYNNLHLCKSLNDNILNWYSYASPNSILSTSLITDYMMGVIDDEGTILGFDSKAINGIIDMYSSDGDTFESQYNNLYNSKFGTFKMTNDLINEMNMGISSYNEIVLKRIEAGKIISPEYILSFDKISRNDKKTASILHKPIIVINRPYYLNRMQDHLLRVISHGDLEIINNLIVQLFFSCSNNKKYLKIYFNTRTINQLVTSTLCRTNQLINNGNREQTKGLLNNIMGALSVITITSNSLGNKVNFDEEKYCKKINKM